MTHQERHTSVEASAGDGTWKLPASPSASALYSDTTGGESNLSPVAVSELRDAPPAGDLWTDWYHRASPLQQQEALLRAMQQGIVYTHQLAAPAHSAPLLRSLLSHLLNGQVKELEPLHLPILEFYDGDLDPTQREAVARAVATPDVCLIQGLPGTGKSRLLAEVILQAVQRGERVLLRAPTAADLDSVLERLAQHPAVCPIRCLAAEEKLSDLPPAIARLTLPERLRHYREITLPAARATRDAALRMLNTRLREQTYWPRLETLAQQYEQLAERLQVLTRRRDNVDAEVERDVSSSPRAAWEQEQIDTIQHLDAQLAGLRAEWETITAKQSQLDNEWNAIRPLLEARRGWRLWTRAWWRALLRSNLREQVRNLEMRRTELHRARQRLEQHLAAQQNERQEIENRYRAERCRLLDEEITRRSTELDGEIIALKRQQDALREQWQNACAALTDEVKPTEISRQAVSIGRTAWERLREQDAQRAAAAAQWLQTVEQGVHTLPQKLAGCANVIAALTKASPGDADPPLGPIFDLLILERTHQVTEAEFAAAARWARRWVLVGEPQPDADRSLHPPRHFFQRLWQNLHVDPRCLPFAWMRRGDRLFCRLRPFAAEQQKWIESEPVVDRPDIELRILSMPHQPPQIVEVVFPACMDIGEAKQFLLHELETLAVQTRSRTLSWLETSEQVILEFCHSAESETRTISLETGVRERIARVSAEDGLEWHTCSLEFARAAGWTRQRAEEWVAERLELRSPGRTILLTRLYRLDPSPNPHSSPGRPACSKKQKHRPHGQPR